MFGNDMIFQIPTTSSFLFFAIYPNGQNFIIQTYSCLPIKQAGSNKQAGWKNFQILINKQALINEQGGIFIP